jgi:hypothetical protein
MHVHTAAITSSEWRSELDMIRWFSTRQPTDCLDM